MGKNISQLIVCDWLETFGGAEQVLKQMLAVTPDAEIYTLWDSSQDFSNNKVIESSLAKGPWRTNKAVSVPLMIPSFSKIKTTSEVEKLIVSSHSFAHHAQVVSNRLAPKRFTYVHTPARYLWVPDLDTRGRGVIPAVGRSILKRVDRMSPIHSGSVAANSNFIAQRIVKCWGLEADVVIYPPVRSKFLMEQLNTFEALTENESELLDKLPADFVLACGRLVEYKKHRDAIYTGKCLGLPVILAGSGPDQEKLVNYAKDLGVSLRVLHRPSDFLLQAIIKRSTYVVFAAIEDFGILTVEALALGARVLVNPIGGAGEIVDDAKSGAYVDFSSHSSISDGAIRVMTLSDENIRSRALDFDESIFRSEYSKWIGHDD
jgi:glycosyltransferase involved in cell wall biosynthesis